METDGWDFNLGCTNAMSCLDSKDGGASVECGINGELNPSNTMPMLASPMQACRSASSQGGIQNYDVQSSFAQGQLNGIPPSMHFSSNNLLLAAKWFHQKKLQGVLASTLPNSVPVTQLHMSNPVWSTSQKAQEAAKVSLRRLFEGAVGANETLSVGSNGSETSSPQQISCDSLISPLVTSMVGPPYQREGVCVTSGKEQVEHPSVFFQARPEFHESLLDSFHSPSLRLNQFRDAMWHSHSQVSHRVLTQSFPSHISLNQPQDACEGVLAKPKPRVRARRGQATDPHSIAERLRRERIADRIRSLQELLPNTNKTDRALMLDEVIEYVKFLLIQVKVLSMSSLGGASLVVPPVTSLSEAKSTQAQTEGGVQDEGSGASQESLPAMEEHVARLIPNNVGAALQFLQRKGLCLMPISLTESSKTSAAEASPSPGNQTCALNQSSTASVTT